MTPVVWLQPAFGLWGALMPKTYIGTWLETATVERLDRISQELCGTRAQAVRFVLETALAGKVLTAPTGDGETLAHADLAGRAGLG